MYAGISDVLMGKYTLALVMSLDGGVYAGISDVC